MSILKYQLAPYKRGESKITCPICNVKNAYRRYIDVTSGDYINKKYGWCDKLSCAHKVSPPDDEVLDIEVDSDIIKPSTKYNTIPKSILNKSLEKMYEDTFSEYVIENFPKKKAIDILTEYKVGYSKRWDRDSTVFWQINKAQEILCGKIMAYTKINGDIKRVRGNESPLISWVHAFIKDFKLKQCFFGEHLLKKYKEKKIIIVESEKSAILGAITYSDRIWLSAGNIYGLSDTKMEALRDRSILLMPDVGDRAFDIWERKKNYFSKLGYDISITDILEKKNNLKDGDDIADLIIKNLKHN